MNLSMKWSGWASQMSLAVRLTAAIGFGALFSVLLLDWVAHGLLILVLTASAMISSLDEVARADVLVNLIGGHTHLVVMTILSSAACLAIPQSSALRTVGTVTVALILETILLSGIILTLLSGEASLNAAPWRNAAGLLGMMLPAVPVALIFARIQAESRDGTEGGIDR